MKFRVKVFLGQLALLFAMLLLLMPLARFYVHHMTAVTVGNYIHIRDVEIGLFLFAILLLSSFSLLTWLLFYRFSRPIQQIIRALSAYQSGKEEEIPLIDLMSIRDKEGDFFQLAETINAMRERILTEMQTLIEEKNEKEAILESLGEGVIAVDGQIRIRYLNCIARKMLGAPKRFLLGNPFPLSTGKSPTPFLEKCIALITASQESKTIVTDSVSIGNLHKRYLDLIAAPVAKGNGVILVLQDKSSHYKVLEMGKDFVANASHELRTPITIIKGFAETLQDLPELTAEMLHAITEKIVRSCERMDNLVKNLLTLADLEHLPDSRFCPCDLVSIVDNCLHMVQAVYHDAEIIIEKEAEEIVVSADSDILELAIMNLMDNAAKYSPAPAQIRVSLRQDKEEVEVSISDQGIGIPKEELGNIFERFYTVNKAHSRRLGGAGLGLSIVKTIIERHEGTIRVESALGKGTTFTINLPISRSSL